MQQTTGFQKGTNLKKCKIFKHLQVAFNMIYGQAFNIHEIFDTLWSSMFTTTKLIDSFHKGLVKFWRQRIRDFVGGAVDNVLATLRNSADGTGGCWWIWVCCIKISEDGSTRGTLLIFQASRPLNYKFSQKLKLLGYGKFNHSTTQF